MSQNLSPPLSTELLQGTESEKIIPIMDKRILKMTIFLAIFVVEFIWALKVGFNGGRIAAMVLCLIVAVLAYFNIGKRK